MSQLQQVLDLLEKGEISKSTDEIKVYHKSFAAHENVKLIMVKENATKWILASGEGQLFDELEGEVINGKGKVCPLTHENRLVLNRYFDYTVPRAFGTKVATMGLGDRLGLASPGHIETVKNSKVKPILAQQSIRELTLTNRSMKDMLDAACFAVFQEGYKGGFGADGDHIKKEEDIKYALGLGVSMLTLDCSEQIDKRFETASSEEIRAEYEKLPQSVKEHFSKTYLNQTFEVNGLSINFD